MSHNITIRADGTADMAFRGSRTDIWHRLGNQMQPGETIEAWARRAGLDWHAVQVPAIADLRGADWDHLPAGMRTAVVDNAIFTVRSDNGFVLGYATERRKEHQPAEVLDWFRQYIEHDDRFELDVAGSLKGGRIIWATASYRPDVTVAGDKHLARLLMTTSFDGSNSTINKMSMVRVVCNNTLDAALSGDRRAVVKTRHNTRFDPDKVGRELADLAGSVDAYKAMGDAMAKVHISKEQISKFFKELLEIPFDATKEDIQSGKDDRVSTRKYNMFTDLNQAYIKTITEGTERGTPWAALNAVTRYVDHDRVTRGGATADEARVLSCQFGTGAAMKAQAVAILTRDHAPSIVPQAAAVADDAWIKGLMSKVNVA